MTPIPPLHADHDPLAIAAYAAGDAGGSELDAAMALVAACAGCALLHHDLRSIAAAMPDLPAPLRGRDFRLTPEQAASLRPAGWRRILAPLAGPRFAFAGPLGTGLATLGIAGFLIAGAAGMPLAGSASAPQDSAAGTAAGAGPSGASEFKAATPSGDQERALGAASMAPALLPVDRQQVRTAEASGVPVPEQPADQAPASAPPAGITSTQAGPVESGPAEAVPGSVPVSAADTGSLPFLPLFSGLILAVGLVLAGLRVAGRRLAG